MGYACLVIKVLERAAFQGGGLAQDIRYGREQEGGVGVRGVSQNPSE